MKIQITKTESQSNAFRVTFRKPEVEADSGAIVQETVDFAPLPAPGPDPDNPKKIIGKDELEYAKECAVQYYGPATVIVKN